MMSLMVIVLSLGMKGGEKNLQHLCMCMLLCNEITDSLRAVKRPARLNDVSCLLHFYLTPLIELQLIGD